MFFSLKVSPHKFIPHIIIKFKNKKVSLFFKNVALCSSLGGKYYRYIIFLPIWIDSVMI